MEKIIRIEETDSGFQIITNKQTIHLGIEQGQSCCETYGYFMSEDNLDEFYGANILSVEIVDDCLNTKELPQEDLKWGGGTMFVNFNTSKGTLQFVAYNAHNGYYSHSAWVKSEQLNFDTYL